MSFLTLYGDHLSGNCYKIELLLSYMQKTYSFVAIDTKQKETKTPDFLAKNPNGKIPVVEFPEGNILWESNAILFYLAEGSEFLPNDLWFRAKILQWMFFEQYSHEPYIAVARYIQFYLGIPKDRELEYKSKKEGGYRALSVMEQHLADKLFFVGDKASIADISLYAYTHVAEEGGFSLDSYPHVKSWLRRMESIPNFQGMVRT